jgi:hypothetical protein
MDSRIVHRQHREPVPPASPVAILDGRLAFHHTTCLEFEHPCAVLACWCWFTEPVHRKRALRPSMTGARQADPAHDPASLSASRSINSIQRTGNGNGKRPVRRGLPCAPACRPSTGVSTVPSNNVLTLMERWRRSGLDAATFARRARCNPRTLTYWRWRLGKAPGRLAPPDIAGDVVRRGGDRAEPGDRGGARGGRPAGRLYRLRLTAAVTPTLLQTVLTALEAPR